MAGDDELERAFAEAEKTDDIDVHFDLKERLLAKHAPEALARHFDFVRRATNDDLRAPLARVFYRHGPVVFPFLEQKLRDERDPLDRATTLQMLGVAGGRYREGKESAAAAARAHLDDPAEIVRERAVMALGWVGGAKDIPTLSKILASNDASSVCGMAACQLEFRSAPSQRSPPCCAPTAPRSTIACATRSWTRRRP